MCQPAFECLINVKLMETVKHLFEIISNFRNSDYIEYLAFIVLISVGKDFSQTDADVHFRLLKAVFSLYIL